jgi:homoserine dehydrogenase
MRFRLAFVGFGKVAQGLTELLVRKHDQLKRDYGFDYRIVAVADTVKESVMDDRGLDPETLLRLAKTYGSLRNYPRGSKGLSSIETIRKANADVLVETTWTNLTDGEPGLTHIKTALTEDLHVVTTNKGPIALAYNELASLAERRQRQLRFEGTVLSGTPVISLATETLAGSTINSIRGILNSTTNYALSEMEGGQSYEEALRTAQERGYAEADLSGDVEGWDAAAKITILANATMKGKLRLGEVRREGIVGITASEVRDAISAGKRIKLVASAYVQDGKIAAQVTCEKLPDTDPLSRVAGVMNAVIISTDVQPDIVIVGPGAGADSAGYALLTDLLAIDRMLSR